MTYHCRSRRHVGNVGAITPLFEYVTHCVTSTARSRKQGTCRHADTPTKSTGLTAVADTSLVASLIAAAASTYAAAGVTNTNIVSQARNTAKAVAAANRSADVTADGRSQQNNNNNNTEGVITASIPQLENTNHTYARYDDDRSKSFNNHPRMGECADSWARWRDHLIVKHAEQVDSVVDNK
eukprot:scaffold10186_cov44-Cyclotella_meneghiniana.AAC.7